ncbi:MAG: sugar kinase [Synergistaceae bacterium]|nr:sugar kinase [Synergistaceae bacterium]
MNPEVLVVGAAITDLQVYPVDKTIIDVASYPAEKMVWTVGGDALNESTIITRLGHKVRLVSCVGNDATAQLILSHCKANDIDTEYIKLDPNKTTAINIGLIWKDGERTFINNRSGSLWTLSPDDINLDCVTGAKILSFASIFNSPGLDEKFMVKLFERAKENDMLICADMVAAKRGEKLNDIAGALKFIDYFFPNYDEGKILTGHEAPEEIADELLKLGVKNVILKIGKRGCLVKNKNENFIVPAYSGANCIDTTGAGDNFASGFISGLLENKTLADCAKMANCAASIAIEAVGATNGLTSREIFDQRFKKM